MHQTHQISYVSGRSGNLLKSPPTTCQYNRRQLYYSAIIFSTIIFFTFMTINTTASPVANASAINISNSFGQDAVKPPASRVNRARTPLSLQQSSQVNGPHNLSSSSSQYPSQANDQLLTPSHNAEQNLTSSPPNNLNASSALYQRNRDPDFYIEGSGMGPVPTPRRKDDKFDDTEGGDDDEDEEEDYDYNDSSESGSGVGHGRNGTISKPIRPTVGNAHSAMINSPANDNTDMYLPYRPPTTASPSTPRVVFMTTTTTPAPTVPVVEPGSSEVKPTPRPQEPEQKFGSSSQVNTTGVYQRYDEDNLPSSAGKIYEQARRNQTQFDVQSTTTSPVPPQSTTDNARESVDFQLHGTSQSPGHNFSNNSMLLRPNVSKTVDGDYDYEDESEDEDGEDAAFEDNDTLDTELTNKTTTAMTNATSIDRHVISKPQFVSPATQTTTMPPKTGPYRPYIDINGKSTSQIPSNRTSVMSNNTSKPTGSSYPTTLFESVQASSRPGYANTEPPPFSNKPTQSGRDNDSISPTEDGLDDDDEEVEEDEEDGDEEEIETEVSEDGPDTNDDDAMGTHVQTGVSLQPPTRVPTQSPAITRPKPVSSPPTTTTTTTTTSTTTTTTTTTTPPPRRHNHLGEFNAANPPLTTTSKTANPTTTAAPPKLFAPPVLRLPSTIPTPYPPMAFTQPPTTMRNNFPLDWYPTTTTPRYPKISPTPKISNVVTYDRGLPNGDADLTMQIYDKVVEIYHSTQTTVEAALKAIWPPNFDVNSLTFEPLLSQPLLFMLALGASVMVLVLLMLLIVYVISNQIQPTPYRDDISLY